MCTTQLCQNHTLINMQYTSILHACTHTKLLATVLYIHYQGSIYWGGRGEASPPKCQSSPPNIFIRFGKTLLSNSHTLAINLLSAINRLKVQNCVIGCVLIEVASAIKFLIILFHSLASFTNNQRNGGWHFEPPSYLLSFSLLTQNMIIISLLYIKFSAYL